MPVVSVGSGNKSLVFGRQSCLFGAGAFWWGGDEWVSDDTVEHVAQVDTVDRVELVEQVDIVDRVELVDTVNQVNLINLVN